MSPERRSAVVAALAVVALTAGLMWLMEAVAGESAQPLRSPWAWLACYLLAINAVCFALYGWDKRAARRARRRVPESHLLWIGLLGGSPAALLAQRLFRHKTQKLKFRVWFWITLLLQVAAGVAYAWLRWGRTG